MTRVELTGGSVPVSVGIVSLVLSSSLPMKKSHGVAGSISPR